MYFYSIQQSAPEVDVDMLVIRPSIRDADKMKLQISYNMEVPKAMMLELKTKVPSILTTFTMLADKYQITRNMEVLKTFAVNRINEAYEAAINYDAQMSQLSIFFRNIIVQYQKTVQVFLDALVKVLETQFKLPGSHERTTLPVLLQELTSSVAAVLETTIERIFENAKVYYNTFVEKMSSVKLSMPVSDVVSVNQFLEQVKTVFKRIIDEVVDLVKNMESLDTMLVKIGETLQAVVEASQELVDTVKSDYLDAVFVNFNFLYHNLIMATKRVAEDIVAMSMEDLISGYEFVMDMFISGVDQFNNAVYGFLEQVSGGAQAYIRVNDGMVEIDLPLSFLQ